MMKPWLMSAEPCCFRAMVGPIRSGTQQLRLLNPCWTCRLPSLRPCTVRLREIRGTRHRGGIHLACRRSDKGGASGPAIR
eukprot:8775471-Heterocapsa_arctica.AAC.1